MTNILRLDIKTLIFTRRTSRKPRTQFYLLLHENFHFVFKTLRKPHPQTQLYSLLHENFVFVLQISTNPHTRTKLYLLLHENLYENFDFISIRVRISHHTFTNF